jgi:diguanylate cyclase (GGDEF)-like protein
MKLGIGLKLGFLLATFGILSTSLTGYYFYTSSRTMLFDAAGRDLLTSTQVLSRNMIVTLDGISDDARLLASIPAAGEVASSPQTKTEQVNKNSLADVFNAMLSTHPEYFQIRLISAEHNGLELVRVDREGHKLIRVQADDLQEKAHYAYFFEALHLKRGEVRLSDIVINHEVGAHSGLNKPTLQVSTPVFSVSGKLLGLIVINIDLNELFGFLKADLPGDYQLYLSNQSGDFLVHPDATQTFGFEHGRRIFVQDAFQPVLALIHGNSQNVVINTRDEQQLKKHLAAAFVRVPFGDKTGKRFLILGLAQPLDNIMRETSKLGVDSVQMVLAFSGLALILSALVSRIVTGPLNNMVKEVKRFSKERVITASPLRRNDELGLLSRSFHDMQAEIMAYLSELNESRTALDHLARHDTLTGLPNRRMFFDRLEHAIGNSRRSGKQLAVLFIDLDRFKEINDTLGHAVGDDVLINVARLLKASVREVDTVARLGGDEFVILLDTIDDPQHVKAVAQKLHDCFQQSMQIGGREMFVHSSIGIGIFPRDGGDADELVHNADQAMYNSKKAGGNTFSF